jgi:hypothetical protein
MNDATIGRRLSAKAPASLRLAFGLALPKITPRAFAARSASSGAIFLAEPPPACALARVNTHTDLGRPNSRRRLDSSRCCSSCHSSRRNSRKLPPQRLRPLPHHKPRPKPSNNGFGAGSVAGYDHHCDGSDLPNVRSLHAVKSFPAPHPSQPQRPGIR